MTVSGSKHVARMGMDMFGPFPAAKQPISTREMEMDLIGNTRTHPVLSWDWRAIDLPAGAREDDDSRNDSGAGVYVLFSIDGRFIKRPKAIKYVYSSTLPVGTVVTYGKLKVVVVSSARNGAGDWEHIERNVVEDYRRLFGDEPPAAPLYIRLWSDSDNMGVISRADFDNVMLLTGR